MKHLVWLVCFCISIWSLAASEKIKLDISFKNGKDSVRFNLVGQPNQVSTVTHSGYRFEIKPEIQKSDGPKKVVHLSFKIFQKIRNQEKLVSSPQLILLDQQPGSLISEDKEKNEKLELKVISHIEG